jgi:cytochrome c-type biogenesis protein CcmH
VTRWLIAVFVVALAVVAPAAASEQHPTLPELERELICPTCHESLAASSSPIADRMREFIRTRIAAGDTKSEIKAKLVDQFGESVLAAPPKSGFNLLAWLLPLIGIVLATAIIGVLAYRWSRRHKVPSPADPSANGRYGMDPELERRLDEELARYDA